MNVATSTCVWAVARLAARFASKRVAFARAAVFDCSPFQREAWYPAQAVATVASASRMVEKSSIHLWRSGSAVTRRPVLGARELRFVAECRPRVVDQLDRPLHRDRFQAAEPLAVGVVQEPE